MKQNWPTDGFSLARTVFLKCFHISCQYFKIRRCHIKIWASSSLKNLEHLLSLYSFLLRWIVATTFRWNVNSISLESPSFHIISVSKAQCQMPFIIIRSLLIFLIIDNYFSRPVYNKSKKWKIRMVKFLKKNRKASLLYSII